MSYLHVVEQKLGHLLGVWRVTQHVPSLHHHADKLPHLEHGEVLSPPEVLATHLQKQQMISALFLLCIP